MTETVRDLLRAFDTLPPAEQNQMAAEILRRWAPDEGLPEPVARAIEAVVQALRQQLPPPAQKKQTPGLPRWEGQVLGKLTREEIYDSAV